MPYYQDNHIRIFNKDCRSMSELLDESVQCVVTSPPYWGLRKYSGEQELIWGDKDCEHQWIDYKASLIHENRNFQKGTQEEVIAEGRELTHIHKYSNLKAGFCSLCGAWKGAYGLEPTPEMYIEHTIEILREIRRVLRKDGVVFWNIGDSYAANRSYQVTDTKWRDVGNTKGSRVPEGMKPKDLCLIPFRVAIAAQEDGFWVRSVIIWNKPNPMPESVNGWRWSRHRIRVDEHGNRVTKGGRLVDCPGCESCLANEGLWLYKGAWRPTESHEYLLMLTKSDQYYCDAEAVREPYSPTERWGGDIYKGAIKRGLEGEDAGLDRERSCFPGTGRNLRSVWAFPTVPFPTFKIDGKKIDHFAVFPEKLPELCIKAATPEGCCSKCGAPWARIVKKGEYQKHESETQTKAVRGLTADRSKHSPPIETETTGWRPTCKCNAPRVPSVVLDPLMGAGTTLLVAKKLNRYAVGHELSEEYCQLTVERCRQQVLL